MAFFTALHVPQVVAQSLQNLRPALKNATFMHPDDIHITLKYLGNPPSEDLEAMWQNAAFQPPSQLSLQREYLHVFECKDMHFLVVKMVRTPALYELHNQHENAATQHGIAAHSFPDYLPHITLASYPPQPLNLSELTLPEDLQFTASEVTLYQSSRPHVTGVGRYTPLKSYSLKS